MQLPLPRWRPDHHGYLGQRSPAAPERRSQQRLFRSEPIAICAVAAGGNSASALLALEWPDWCSWTLQFSPMNQWSTEQDDLGLIACTHHNYLFPLKLIAPGRVLMTAMTVNLRRFLSTSFVAAVCGSRSTCFLGDVLLRRVGWSSQSGDRTSRSSDRVI